MSWQDRADNHNRRKAEEEEAIKKQHLEEIGLFVEQNGKKLLDVLAEVKARESLIQIRDEIWKLGDVSRVEFYGLRDLADQAIKPFSEEHKGHNVISWFGYPINIKGFSNWGVEEIIDEKRYPRLAMEQKLRLKTNPPLNPKFGVMVSVSLQANWDTWEEYWQSPGYFNEGGSDELVTRKKSYEEGLSINAYIPENKVVYGSEPVITINSSVNSSSSFFSLQDELSVKVENFLVEDVIRRKTWPYRKNILPYGNSK